MNTKFHNLKTGKDTKVITRYSDMIVVLDEGASNAQSITVSDLQEIQLAEVLSFSDHVSAKVVEVPAETVLQDQQDEPETKVADGRIDVNSVKSATVLDRHLLGLGRQSCKKIIDRRPEGGYTDFAQLRETNKDLPLGEEGWSRFERAIKFGE